MPGEKSSLQPPGEKADVSAIESKGGSLLNNDVKSERGVPISFRKSVLSMIPLTQSNRHALRQISSMVRDENAAEGEEKRIEGIQGLITSGRYHDALQQLLEDSESDLQYFNRMRTQMEEEMDRRRLPNRDETATTRPHGTDDVKQALGTNNAAECQWTGMDADRRLFHCVNHCLVHPWKVCHNSDGGKVLLQLDRCRYHSRHCVDVDARHVGELVEIQHPNEHALCNECYVQKYRQRPPNTIRIPGRRTVKVDGLATDIDSLGTQPASRLVPRPSCNAPNSPREAFPWKAFDEECIGIGKVRERAGTLRATFHALAHSLGVDRTRVLRTKWSLSIRSHAIKRKMFSDKSSANSNKGWW